MCYRGLPDVTYPYCNKGEKKNNSVLYSPHVPKANGGTEFEIISIAPFFLIPIHLLTL